MSNYLPLNVNCVAKHLTWLSDEHGGGWQWYSTEAGSSTEKNELCIQYFTTATARQFLDLRNVDRGSWAFSWTNSQAKGKVCSIASPSPGSLQMSLDILRDPV